MSDITILEEIRLLASELSNMSPKTQLEIVKLCKNICLKTKDYLDGVVEDIEDETTRATAKENEIASDLSNEITRATAKENEIIDDLDDEIERATTNEGLLNTKITNLKNMFGFIEITTGTGTLTDEQYAEALKPYCIICLNNINLYYKKTTLNNIITFSQFEIGNYSTYWHLGETYINVSENKTYQLNNTSLKTDIYSTTQTDALLNGKQNTLEFNPTIPSGTTPTPLSNLKDGKNYYSLSGGGAGANKYLHSIAFQTNDSNMVMGLVNVLSDKSTALTINELFNSAFLYSGVAVSYDSEYYPVFINIDSSQNTIMVTGLIRNSGNVIYLNTSIPKADITITQDSIKPF